MEEQAVVSNENPQETINAVVDNVKSEGLFDSFRKECLEEFDNMNTYHQLKKTVENLVSSFLSKNEYYDGMRKNSLRSSLRVHLTKSDAILNGVKQLVDEVLSLKGHSICLRIDKQVDNYLIRDIEKPQSPQEQNQSEILQHKTSQLPLPQQEYKDEQKSGNEPSLSQQLQKRDSQQAPITNQLDNQSQVSPEKTDCSFPETQITQQKDAIDQNNLLSQSAGRVCESNLTVEMISEQAEEKNIDKTSKEIIDVHAIEVSAEQPTVMERTEVEEVEMEINEDSVDIKFHDTTNYNKDDLQQNHQQTNNQSTSTNCNDTKDAENCHTVSEESSISTENLCVSHVTKSVEINDTNTKETIASVSTPEEKLAVGNDSDIVNKTNDKGVLEEPKSDPQIRETDLARLQKNESSKQSNKDTITLSLAENVTESPVKDFQQKKREAIQLSSFTSNISSSSVKDDKKTSNKEEKEDKKSNNEKTDQSSKQHKIQLSNFISDISMKPNHTNTTKTLLTPENEKENKIGTKRQIKQPDIYTQKFDEISSGEDDEIKGEDKSKQNVVFKMKNQSDMKLTLSLITEPISDDSHSNSSSFTEEKDEKRRASAEVESVRRKSTRVRNLPLKFRDQEDKSKTEDNESISSNDTDVKDVQDDHNHSKIKLTIRKSKVETLITAVNSNEPTSTKRNKNIELDKGSEKRKRSSSLDVSEQERNRKYQRKKDLLKNKEVVTSPEQTLSPAHGSSPDEISVQRARRRIKQRKVYSP